MPKLKLTKKVVGDVIVPPGKSQDTWWDTEVARLGLRAYASGRKVYIYRYRPDGGGRSTPERTLTLGVATDTDSREPTLTLDDARDAARIAAGKLAKGADPAADAREAKRAAKSNLRAILRDDGPYQQHLEAAGIVNRTTVRNTLLRYLAPLMGRDVKDITRADYMAIIDATAQAGKLGAAGDIRKHSRQLEEWCVARGLKPHNVLAGLRQPLRSRAERLKQKRKSRSLKDHEIIAVWRATATPDPFHQIVRIALLTAMRRHEAAALTRAMLGADRITLPETLTKSGREHQIPITETLRQLLDAQPPINDLIFPSPRKRVRIKAWTSRINKLRTATGIGDLKMHMLRKTCRTLMTRCGTPKDIARQAIGHQHRNSLDVIYDHAEHWPQRVAAYAAVETYITNLIDNMSAAAVVAAARAA
jgi:integrase